MRNLFRGVVVIAVVAVALSATFAANAQSDDAAYCRALSEQYQKFYVKTGGHSPTLGTADGSVAVEQCKTGNFAAAIPVLERKLRDAKVTLPSRG